MNKHVRKPSSIHRNLLGLADSFFIYFLAGLSAGASIVAVLISNKFGKDNYYFKAAALIAPVAIILGLALLVIDLGKPLSFYWILLLYNFDSVMSIGVALLLVYTPLSVYIRGWCV